MGFHARVEAAAATFALLCPLALVAVGTLRLARRIRAGRAAGPELRRALSRRRAANQMIAMGAIVLAALLALGRRGAAFGF
jgi:hypothetical protein